jgi:hypothetical protein
MAPAVLVCGCSVSTLCNHAHHTAITMVTAKVDCCKVTSFIASGGAGDSEIALERHNLLNQQVDLLQNSSSYGGWVPNPHSYHAPLGILNCNWAVGNQQRALEDMVGDSLGTCLN